MQLIKKNIWSLFYLILFLGIIILSSMIFNIKSSSESKYKNEQENITKITANSINSVFLQYEMILNILGKQLSKDYNYNSKINSQEILDNLIKLNPAILGFSLVKPNGELFISSSNIANLKLPNLATKKETKDTFLYTLTSHKMVVGRTYFPSFLNSLVIPIRKTIIDENDKVVAVMTAGIDVKKGFGFLIKNIKTQANYDTFLFRNYDNFFQIAPKKDLENKEIYKHFIPQEEVDKATEFVSSKYNKTMKEIKEEEFITTIESVDARNVLTSSVYINNYDLWVVTQIPLSIIKSEIYKKSSILILLFILVSFIMYMLFKYISDYEKKKQKLLYYEATHDHLTDLYNRLYLSENFDKLENKKPFTLLFIDMDNFKSVNDNYGHAYGDKILRTISNRLQDIKAPKDTLVRYSGDEFLYITDETESEKINELASLIISKLSETYIIDQYNFLLGSSIGIAQYPSDGNTFDKIKRYADISLYEAKKTKNTYCLFDSGIKEKYLRSSLIEEELKYALNKEEIYLVYQPQVGSDGKINGVEALVRWDNNKLGFVSPQEFILIAEATGLMGKIGDYIMDTSIKEIAYIQKKVNKEFHLSINISVKQFIEVDFFNKLLSSIDKYDFDKLLVTLEVTENIFIEDINFILELLNKIKKEGIKISLDDFGTGYSSLSLLKKLPIDELKIDKSFVDDILIDNDSLSMVESIISIGKKLELVLLAEGVETIEQKDKLCEFDCDLFQGYYYSKPLTKDDLIKYLEDDI